MKIDGLIHHSRLNPHSRFGVHQNKNHYCLWFSSDFSVSPSQNSASYYRMIFWWNNWYHITRASVEAVCLHSIFCLNLQAWNGISLCQIASWNCQQMSQSVSWWNVSSWCYLIGRRDYPLRNWWICYYLVAWNCSNWNFILLDISSWKYWKLFLKFMDFKM